jgi:hypothetical protein
LGKKILACTFPNIAFECRKGFLKEKYIVEMISEVFPDFSEI